MPTRVVYVCAHMCAWGGGERERLFTEKNEVELTRLMLKEWTQRWFNWWNRVKYLTDYDNCFSEEDEKENGEIWFNSYCLQKGEKYGLWQYLSSRRNKDFVDKINSVHIPLLFYMKTWIRVSRVSKATPMVWHFQGIQCENKVWKWKK